MFSEDEMDYEWDEWQDYFSMEVDNYYEYNERSLSDIFMHLEYEEDNESTALNRVESTTIKKVSPTYFSKMYIEALIKLKAKKEGAKDKMATSFRGALNAYIVSSYYEAFLGLSGDEKDRINFASLRFTPVLMHHPRNTLTSVLSFYVGSFRAPISFRTLHSMSFRAISPTSKRQYFPSLNNIRFSKKKGDFGTACEASLPFCNFYFFWKDKKTEHVYNTYASYKNEELLAKKARLNIAFLSSFFVQKTSKAERKTFSNYMSVYGLEFNFSSKHFFFNSLNSLCSVLNRNINISSFSFREEMGAGNKMFELNTGLSYQGSLYLPTEKPKNPKDALNFYIQDKFRYKIFSFCLTYNLLKFINDKRMQHSYGLFYSIGNTYMKFKNEVWYKDDVYKLKASLMIYPHISYFRLFNISSFLHLQEKRLNRHIVKKYEVATYSFFPMEEHISLKLGIGLSQQNKGKLCLWEKESIFTSLTFRFIFEQDKCKEIVNTTLKYNSFKNFLDFSCNLKIEY